MSNVIVTGSGIAKEKEAGKVVVVSALSLKVAPKTHEISGKVKVASYAPFPDKKSKVAIATDSVEY